MGVIGGITLLGPACFLRSRKDSSLSPRQRHTIFTRHLCPHTFEPIGTHSLVLSVRTVSTTTQPTTTGRSYFRFRLTPQPPYTEQPPWIWIIPATLPLTPRPSRRASIDSNFLALRMMRLAALAAVRLERSETWRTQARTQTLHTSSPTRSSAWKAGPSKNPPRSSRLPSFLTKSHSRSTI